MNVLLADDDPSVRKLVSIILSRLLPDVDITECDNGIDALHALSSTRECSLAILDVSMPGLSGLQVLRGIRESPQLRHLPVMMLTAYAQEESVIRALDLGVADYVAKPLRPGEFGDRIAKALASIETTAARTTAPRTPFQPLAMDPETRVFVVDGDPEFRHFFIKTVGKLCAVEEVSSGLAALERCHLAPPYALFVGSDLGVVNGDMLAEQLRTEKALAGIRIIGVFPPRLVLRAKKRSAYDAVIMRSFVTEVFMETFSTLLPRQSDEPGLLDTVPDLKLLGIAACEEALTSMLNRPLDLRPAQARNQRRRYTAASMVLQIGAVPLRLTLSAPQSCIPRLNERLTAEGRAFASNDQLVARLVQRIGDLLGRELEARGFAVLSEEAAPEVPRGSAPAPASNDLATIAFDVQGAGISFRLDLQDGSHENACDVDPGQVDGRPVGASHDVAAIDVR